MGDHVHHDNLLLKGRPLIMRFRQLTLDGKMVRLGLPLEYDWRLSMKTLFVFAVTVFLLFGNALAQSRRSTQDKIVENWVAAWNSHDVIRVVPLFTDDVLYEDVTFGAVNHGSTDLRKFASFFFEAVPDMKFEVVKSFVQGKRGTIEWIFSGTDAGVYKTGKKFRVRGVSILELDHARIARNLDFYDSATIMRQVGLLPTSH